MNCDKINQDHWKRPLRLGDRLSSEQCIEAIATKKLGSFLLLFEQSQAEIVEFQNNS